MVSAASLVGWTTIGRGRYEWTATGICPITSAGKYRFLFSVILALLNGRGIRSDEIRRDLEPGEHLLHCELLEETLDPQGRREFRIISVMR